jgi:hypothetical protein
MSTQVISVQLRAVCTRWASLDDHHSHQRPHITAPQSPNHALSLTSPRGDHCLGFILVTYFASGLELYIKQLCDMASRVWLSLIRSLAHPVRFTYCRSIVMAQVHCTPSTCLLLCSACSWSKSCTVGLPCLWINYTVLTRHVQKNKWIKNSNFHKQKLKIAPQLMWRFSVCPVLPSVTCWVFPCPSFYENLLLKKQIMPPKQGKTDQVKILDSFRGSVSLV